MSTRRDCTFASMPAKSVTSGLTLRPRLPATALSTSASRPTILSPTIEVYGAYGSMGDLEHAGLDGAERGRGVGDRGFVVPAAGGQRQQAGRDGTEQAGGPPAREARVRHGGAFRDGVSGCRRNVGGGARIPLTRSRLRRQLLPSHWMTDLRCRADSDLRSYASYSARRGDGHALGLARTADR